MKELTLNHVPENTPLSHVRYRKAVRAIILQSHCVFLNYLPEDRAYEFPGGGVESGESLHEALRREIEEETGCILDTIADVLFSIVEMKIDEFFPDSIYHATHYYFRCTMKEEMGKIQLSEQEKRDKIQYVWTPIEKAIEMNERRLCETTNDRNQWIIRELKAMEMYKDCHLTTG